MTDSMPMRVGLIHKKEDDAIAEMKQLANHEYGTMQRRQGSNKYLKPNQQSTYQDGRCINIILYCPAIDVRPRIDCMYGVKSLE